MDLTNNHAARVAAKKDLLRSAALALGDGPRRQESELLSALYTAAREMVAAEKGER